MTEIDFTQPINMMQSMVVVDWMKKQKNYVLIYYLGKKRLDTKQARQVDIAIKRARMMSGETSLKFKFDGDSNQFVFGLNIDEGSVFISEGSVEGINKGTYNLVKMHICYLPLK